MLIVRRACLICAVAATLAVAPPPVLSQAEDLSKDGRALELAGVRFSTASPAEVSRVEGRIPPGLRGPAASAGGLLLVQFREGLATEDRALLLQHHRLRMLATIPRRAAVVRVPPSGVAGLLADPGIAWVGRLHPAWRLSPSLPAPAEITPADLPLRVVASITSDREPRQVVGELAQSGIDATRRGTEDLLVSVEDRASLLRLLGSESVLFVEPEPRPRLMNNSSRGICQSGTPGVESVHAQGVRGGGQVLAVMDSGVETGHCCFSSPGKIIDNRAWGGGQLGPDCSADHGTHVSGTATCSNGGDHDGGAPDAALILQDVGRPGACQNVYPPSPLSSAWSDARGRGARVHSNSWGGGFNFYGSDSRAIDEFIWNNQDFLILYAAGNDGPSPGSLGLYSNAKNSITVGGSGNGSSRESMYGASSRGPAGDGRMLPDLTAPAAGVSSSRSATACGWTSMWGTSMATPAVAATAVLVRDYFESGFYPEGVAQPADAFSPTAALVKAVLLVSARDMSGSGTGGARPNDSQGFGRVTLDDALWFAGDPAGERLVVLDDREAATGLTAAAQVDEFTLTLPVAGELRAMLVWSDAPGSPLAARALVNDLDLELETADGSVYRGNQGFSGGWTASTSATRDDLNNKEAVFLQSVPAGDVTLRVIARELGDVTAHPQDYALVVVSPATPAACDAPLPTGVGNTVRHEKDAGELLASWDDRAADHYVVYRGPSPDFYAPGLAPHADGVQDERPAMVGVQWTDGGALGDGANWFYLYSSANTCGEEAF